MSHSSWSRVQAQLGKRDWKVLWQSPPQKVDDRRPPFVEFTVELAEFEHLGFRGSLLLQFINDRLSRAVFGPSEAAKYFEAVGRMPGIARDSDNLLRIQPSSQVRLSTSGRASVSWDDECLAQEAKDWIFRYSSAGGSPQYGRPTSG